MKLGGSTVASLEKRVGALKTLGKLPEREDFLRRLRVVLNPSVPKVRPQNQRAATSLSTLASSPETNA